MTSISFCLHRKNSIIIYYKFFSSLHILWEDFVQTAIKGALSGYLIGCVLAFMVSLIADKFKFLERGLLPLGNFLAAMPIIGIAPILVMWYGYGWHSKAAVVALATGLVDDHPRVIDVQWRTDHLAMLGVTEISRSQYLERLHTVLSSPDPQLFTDTPHTIIRPLA